MGSKNQILPGLNWSWGACHHVPRVVTPTGARPDGPESRWLAPDEDAAVPRGADSSEEVDPSADEGLGVGDGGS